jgi:gliding motility-associated-like protein
MFGCDSILYITNIKVNHSEAHTIAYEMCEGNVLRYNGLQYTIAGSYPVMFKNKAGCDSLVTLELKVNPLPTIEIATEDNRNYCVGDSVFLRASGAQTYVWIYEDVDTVQNDYLRTTLFNYKNAFSITGVDDKGCINTASANIEAHPCCNIFMPNAFSPNGDGNNDVFKPVTLGHPNGYVMHIFNRWGQTIFTSYNVEKGWDGDINGKPADMADYFYRISGKCVNGEIINLKGNCTLIR